MKNKSCFGYVISGGNCPPFISRLKIIDENLFESVQNIIYHYMFLNWADEFQNASI